MTQVKYSELTVPELRKLCKERGLSKYAHAKKADLIEMLLKTDPPVEPTNEPDWESKAKYVDRVEKGTIIAFNVGGNKVKSAKVVKKSSKEKLLKCVTSYGKEYIVRYEDVIWVKTGMRWPRGVYNLLKGIEENEQDASSKNAQ